MLHSRVRLVIVAILAGAEAADFSTVRGAIKTTYSNASMHLRKLEDAGYIAVEKRVVGRKSQTLYALTENGRKAPLDYVAHLESLLPPGNDPDREATDGSTAVKQALRQLLGDFLSAILFLLVYALSGSLFAAAAIAVAAGLAQLARIWLTGCRVEPMQWMSLGLVVVLGGATMLTQSLRFMMVKPTIVHFAVAFVLLRRGWMIRYLPKIVVRNVPKPTIVATGYAWAALLAALGLTNLIIALHFDFVTWAWFISVGSVGAKLAAFALQYGVFRAIIRQRVAQSAA